MFMEVGKLWGRVGLKGEIGVEARGTRGRSLYVRFWRLEERPELGIQMWASLAWRLLHKPLGWVISPGEKMGPTPNPGIYRLETGWFEKKRSV